MIEKIEKIKKFFKNLFLREKSDSKEIDSKEKEKDNNLAIIQGVKIREPFKFLEGIYDEDMFRDLIIFLIDIRLGLIVPDKHLFNLDDCVEIILRHEIRYREIKRIIYDKVINLLGEEGFIKLFKKYYQISATIMMVAAIHSIEQDIISIKSDNEKRFYIQKAFNSGLLTAKQGKRDKLKDELKKLKNAGYILDNLDELVTEINKEEEEEKKEEENSRFIKIGDNENENEYNFNIVKKDPLCIKMVTQYISVKSVPEKALKDFINNVKKRLRSSGSITKALDIIDKIVKAKYHSQEIIELLEQSKKELLEKKKSLTKPNS